MYWWFQGNIFCTTAQATEISIFQINALSSFHLGIAESKGRCISYLICSFLPWGIYSFIHSFIHLLIIFPQGYAYWLYRQKKGGREEGRGGEWEKERERERERDINMREKHQLVASHSCPNCAPTQGSNLQSFWCMGWCSNQLSHLAWVHHHTLAHASLSVGGEPAPAIRWMASDWTSI